MKSLLLFFFISITLNSCIRGQGEKVNIPLGSTKGEGKESVATFAEGCFWHSEIIFQSLVGVRDAVSGFAGGTTKNAKYGQIGGAAETVQVYYDSSKISFATLVDAFFASMDPTQLNRQGNDVGPQYRSIAFYRNENEKVIVEAAMKKLSDSKKYSNKIVTEILPYTAFFPAGDEHQEFVYYHPTNTYVQVVSIPEFLKFKKEFKGNFK